MTKRRFTTFDEKALDDGALADAVANMAAGDSPTVAILKGVRPMDQTKPAVQSTINWATLGSSLAAAFSIPALADPMILQALESTTRFVPVQYLPWVVLALNAVVFVRRNFFQTKTVAGVVKQQ